MGDACLVGLPVMAVDDTAGAAWMDATPRSAAAGSVEGLDRHASDTKVCKDLGQAHARLEPSTRTIVVR